MCSIVESVSITLNQERMKVREVIPHIGPIPIVIPLKLFLEGINFLADNVTSRVTWNMLKVASEYEMRK